YTPTLYLNTAELKTATAVDMTPGKVVSGVDVKLVSLPAVSIRGRVNNQTGATGPISVLIFPNALGTASGSATVKPDGKFEFSGVVPGRYWLLARLSAGVSYQAKQVVEVTDRDLENLELTLDKGVSVNGRVTVESGGEPIRNLRTIRVSLQSSDASS